MFVAVTVLITKLLSGIFIFVSCRPVQKRWNPLVKGTCWDINVLCRYWSFSGGEFGFPAEAFFLMAKLRTRVFPTNLWLPSVGGGDGSCSGGTSLVHHLGPPGEEIREDWAWFCFELGAFVGVPEVWSRIFGCCANEMMVSRTGIVAAIKTTYIKGSDLENDFTCKLAVSLLRFGDHY